MGSVGGPVHVEEFEKFLSDFFLKYFSWLDEMENLLKCQVSASLEELKVEWATIEEPIPAMGLEDMSTDRLNDETYLYLPKCIT